MERSTVVVIGAGIAGLVAASSLAGEFDVAVLDKGRGVGGRLATRRVGEATFDHGAQFITTHSRAFETMVGEWRSAGVTAPWFHGQLGPAGVARTDGHVRHRGVAAMTSIAKHVAESLEVHCSARVESISCSATGWTVSLGGGAVEGGEVSDVIEAAAVVLTPPVPQTLELLDRGDVPLAPEDRRALDSIAYDPCIAVLAPLDGPSGLPDPGAVAPDAGPIDIMVDNSLKGVSAVPCVTIHATAAFSREHWDASDRVVIGALLDAADLAAPAVLDDVQVMRWRYARPTVLDQRPCRALQGLPPMVCAGDAFGVPRVEGAALSGRAAAAEIRALLGS